MGEAASGPHSANVAMRHEQESDMICGVLTLVTLELGFATPMP